MPRLPLLFPSEPRDASRQTDSWASNAFGEGVRARKRPGIETAVPTVGTVGQGLGNWNLSAVSVVSDVLYIPVPPPASVIPNSTNWLTWKNENTTSAPAMRGSGFDLNANAWDNSTNYNPGDVVTVDGNTWYAVVSNTNKKPEYNKNSLPYWSRYKTHSGSTVVTADYTGTTQWDIGEPYGSGNGLSSLNIRLYIGGVLTSTIGAVNRQIAYVNYFTNMPADFPVTQVQNGQYPSGLVTTNLDTDPWYVGTQDYARSK